MKNDIEHIQEFLREDIRLTRENNKLLKKLWHAQMIGFWGKILFFIVLVGIPVFLYQYYLSDYVSDIRQSYEDLKDKADVLQNISNKNPVDSVVGNLKKNFE